MQRQEKKESKQRTSRPQAMSAIAEGKDLREDAKKNLGQKEGEGVAEKLGRRNHAAPRSQKLVLLYFKRQKQEMKNRWKKKNLTRKKIREEKVAGDGLAYPSLCIQEPPPVEALQEKEGDREKETAAKKERQGENV